MGYSIKLRQHNFPRSLLKAKGAGTDSRRQRCEYYCNLVMRGKNGNMERSFIYSPLSSKYAHVCQHLFLPPPLFTSKFRYVNVSYMTIWKSQNTKEKSEHITISILSAGKDVCIFIVIIYSWKKQNLLCFWWSKTNSGQLGLHQIFVCRLSSFKRKNYTKLMSMKCHIWLLS